MVHWPPEKPALREQRVQQPRQRTTRRIAQEELSSAPVAWPAPITHVSVKEASTSKEDKHVVRQEHQPVQNVLASTTPSERELRVKVWEQDNPPTPLPESATEPVKRNVEDAPTSPLETPEHNERSIEDAPTSSLEMLDQPVKEHISQQEGDISRNDVEHLDTTPMPNHVQTAQQARSHPVHRDTPFPALPAESERYRQQNRANTPVPDVSLSPKPVASSTVQRGRASVTSSVQERRVSPTLASQVSRSRKSPIPFIILLALLGILVLGGGAWVLLAQPFSVSPVTQPMQDFNDAGLGVALSYPTSWTVQRTPTSALFADSSHTAQVKIQAANDTSDAATYVQQVAKKSGMTAIKPLGTTSFAGLSWQQMQGNVQQDGANYTTTMLAATHGNRTYVLTQMAPQNVYTDEESVVFSAVRNSLKFL